MIKKLSIITCLVLGAITMQAQHNVTSFFNELGMANIRTEEYSKAHDTIVMVDHRIDDVIWSRVVYRIIDLRYRQNYQLYFPTRPDDTHYKNLLRLIIDAVIADANEENGLRLYRPGTEHLKPDFTPENIILNHQLPRDAFFIRDRSKKEPDDEDYMDITKSKYMLVNCVDTTTGELKFQDYKFEDITCNQVKYLIQEVVFFDKHTSRLHTKIMAIAPLHPWKIMSTDSTQVSQALQESVMFWIPFDDLRPYMAMQYIIPNRNETKHVTYDEFFQKRLFTSYIVGEGNMYNRMIPDYEHTYEGIKKEQDRIAMELLNFEQDLWEY